MQNESEEEDVSLADRKASNASKKKIFHICSMKARRGASLRCKLCATLPDCSCVRSAYIATSV